MREKLKVGLYGTLNRTNLIPATYCYEKTCTKDGRQVIISQVGDKVEKAEVREGMFVIIQIRVEDKTLKSIEARLLRATKQGG